MKMADLQQRISFLYHSVVEDKKKLAIVAVSAVVVLILLLVVFRHHSTPSVEPNPTPTPKPGPKPDSCKTLQELPKHIDLQKIEPAANQDKTALVRFAGYLSVPGKEETHYELKQTSMRTSQMSKSDMLVNIETDCADVVLEIHKDMDYRIKTIRVRPNELDAGFQECEMTVTSSADLWFKFEEQYLCDRLVEYKCIDTLGDRSQTKSLVFVLQLELEGDSASISSGKFSKHPHYCPIDRA